MKKLVLAVLTAVTTLFFTTKTTAQEVKSQTEMIKTLKKGRYKIKASTYSYTGEMEILNVEADKSKPSGNFEVYLEMFPDDESGEGKTRYYYRDNLAFPATYVWNSYAGMSKVRSKAGYVLNTNRDTGKERLIVLDKYIFVIQDWTNKDEYYGITVLEREVASENKEKKKKKKKRGGFGGFFKALKEGVKTSSSSGKDVVNKIKKEVLQPYLDKAFAKQEEEKKKAKNVTLQKQEDELRKKVKQADRDYVKHYNDSLSNTAKYKRIDAHRARMANMNNGGGSVTLHNKTGRDVYIFEEGSRNGTPLRANSSGSFNCKKALYFSFSSNSSVNGNGSRITSGGNCGGNINVQ